MKYKTLFILPVLVTYSFLFLKPESQVQKRPASLATIFEELGNFISDEDYSCYKIDPTTVKAKDFKNIRPKDNKSSLIKMLGTSNIEYEIKELTSGVTFIIIPNVAIEINSFGKSKIIQTRGIYIAVLKGRIDWLRIDLLHNTKRDFYSKYELTGYNEFFHLKTELGVGCNNYSSMVVALTEPKAKSLLSTKYPLINEDKYFGNYQFCLCP